MKKLLKIIGVTLVLIIALSILLPILFEGKIIELVKKTANNNIDATLDFEDADISLFRSFPNATLTLDNLTIVNHPPFKGDTLVQVGKAALKLPFKSLFQGTNQPVKIKSFQLENIDLNIQIDSSGNTNYDIAKEASNGNNSENGGAFTFNLDSYQIANSNVTYHDLGNTVQLELKKLELSGNGNLSAEESILKTHSEALVSFAYDSINYLHNNSVTLDADIQLNLKNNTYTFLDNKAFVNQLPLVFEGFVKVNEDNQEIDLSFETPSSDFKNFLALIPEVYSKNIEGVSTTGNFDVKGTFKGVIDEVHIPEFDITIHSENASFKYPDLPKSLENVTIQTEIGNKTGLSKDTYIDIDKLSFTIDNDIFNAKAQITELTDNMKIAGDIKGTIDLGKLEKIYPAEEVKGLKGILSADLAVNFDMNSIERKRYENTKTSGTIELQGFAYNSEELNNPLSIVHTSLIFNPKTVRLKDLDATIGQTDFNATGTIDNLWGFLFNDENFRGNFNLNSNTFSVNDFMASQSENEQTKETDTTTEQLKIPSFLDCTFNARANTVIYDDITLKNVSGVLIIKDQKAELNDMQSEVFGGTLGFDGSVSTKTETPEFTMALDVKNFDIAQSFSSLDLFTALAPIAHVIQGKINTDISLSGDLTNNFIPQLSTLNGDVVAQLLSSNLSSENAPLLQKLEQNLSFLDFKKLDLNDLKTSLTFKEGRVQLKPFMVKYDDIEIAVSGGHGFDKSVEYDAVINVPAKYLGKEAANLIAQLSEEEKNSIKVPVKALISGKFNHPDVKTDLKSAITDLSKQIANQQKEKLVSQGKEKVTNALEELLNKNQPKDSIAPDSTKTEKTNKVKDAAKGLLKDILSSKKKKDTVDSSNNP